MSIPFIGTLLAFLEVGIVFYFLTAVLLISNIFFLPSEPTENGEEYLGFPTASVFCNLLLFAIVLYHYKVDMGSWTNWLLILAGYLIVGVLWSTAKWVLLCRKAKEFLQKAISRFNEKFAKDEESVKNEKEAHRRFMEYLFVGTRLKKYAETPLLIDKYRAESWTREEIIGVYIPQVSAHKALVITWILCWPYSILKWAIADALYDIANGIFNAIRGLFQKIASSTFAGL